MKKIIYLATLFVALNSAIFAQIQNGANTAPPVIYTCNTSGVIAINTPVSFTSQFGTSAVIDCSFYKSLQVTCTSIGTTGVLVPQFSNDPSFTNLIAAPITGGSGGYSGSITGNTLFTIAVIAKYCRFTMTTATTAGTTALTVAGTQIAGRDVYLLNNVGLSSSSSLVGDVGIQYRAFGTSGASCFHLVSAGTTNASIVKSSAGRIYGFCVSNTSAAWKYVKIHNQATTPTAGTGIVQTIAVAPSSNVNVVLEGGIIHTTGISITTTTGSADNDATAVTAGDLIIDIFYL